MIRNTITPQDEYEYFFGYYDLQPYDETGALHLTHRVKFKDRLPTAQDVAEIGYIDVAKKSFHKIAETRAWNFQQGALLVWYESGKSVMFNDFDGEKYVTRVVSIDGQELACYDMPFGAVDKDREKGLSINFSRIYNFRPGYGYSNLKDAFYDENTPKDDGIFLVDMKTGEKKLLVSYEQMKTEFAEEPFTSGKLVVNHITFNPSGTEFVFLLRNFPKEGSKWGTVLAMGDLNGKIWKLTNFQVNSHYSFKDDETLAIFSCLPESGVYIFNVKTGEKTRIYNETLDCRDTHVNYSPDKTYFIGDGYTEAGEVRSLYRYDFKTKQADKLFSVHTEVMATDIRCDLHARFAPNGEKISYDTTENKRREIVECYL